MAAKQTIPPAIQARVDKGVKFLDVYKPTWWRDIDVNTLDLSNGDYCVLGQLYNGYSFGTKRIREEVSLMVTVPDVREPLPGVMIHITTGVIIDFEELGFQAIDRFANCGNSYKHLTAAWKKVIRERQKEAKRG